MPVIRRYSDLSIVHEDNQITKCVMSSLRAAGFARSFSVPFGHDLQLSDESPAELMTTMSCLLTKKSF